MTDDAKSEPINAAMWRPVLVAGVPWASLWQWVPWFVLMLADHHTWWLAGGGAVHFVIAYLCQVDPEWFETLKGLLRYPNEIDPS